MKYHTLRFVFLFLCIFSKACFSQITLEHTVFPQTGMGDDFYLAQISETETKYVLCDTVTNTFSLFNMDFTPFLSNISVPEPFSHFDFQAIYITRTLFDCDSSNIEYIYESTTDNTKMFRIVRTDGTILFQRDSTNGPFCLGGCLGFSDIIRPIRNTSDGTKLFLQTGINGRLAILIYQLCGTLYNSIFDVGVLNQSIISIYPNPTSNSLQVKFNSLNNMEDFELNIMDNFGQVYHSLKMNSNNIITSIDVSSLSNGVYYYSLHNKGKIIQSGKFILSK
jgi:hypothetical protein